MLNNDDICSQLISHGRLLNAKLKITIKKMLATTVILVCVSMTSAADSESQLRFLINEETTLRETFTTRVQALRQQTEAFAATIGNIHGSSESNALPFTCIYINVYLL